MSLDPNSQAVNSAASALQSVGLAQPTGSYQPQHQTQQQQQQQLSQNQFFQQQVRQMANSQYASAQAVPSAQDYQAAAYQQATQQLNHLAQATGLAPPGAPNSLQQMQLPQNEFDSREELVTYIHQYAKDNGFGIVISHSNEKAIYFTCELGGTYRNKRNINDKERKRKLTTRKINCPFSMVANCKKNDQDEIVKWILRITNPDHNHDKLNLNESFPMLRRRNPEINRQIRELYLKGHKPLVIEKMLKETFKDILINREDIYNETRKMKREEKIKTNLSSGEGVPQTSHMKAVVVPHDEHNSYDQNIPSLLQQGLPMNLSSQYQQLPVHQQQQQQQYQPVQQSQQQQSQQGYQMGSSVVNQALANAQQPQDDKSSINNIDINLVKQQGI